MVARKPHPIFMENLFLKPIDQCVASRKDAFGDWRCLKLNGHDGAHEDISGIEWVKYDKNHIKILKI